MLFTIVVNLEKLSTISPICNAGHKYERMAVKFKVWFAIVNIVKVINIKYCIVSNSNKNHSNML